MDQKRLTHKAKYTVKYEKNQNAAYHECIDKLGELEDLAEQGKLLKLPCAVGDTVYYPDEDYDFEKEDFGKTVFLTKSDAETALQEMNTGVDD